MASSYCFIKPVMSNYMKPALFILLFPWIRVLSQACSSAYTQRNFKISGHTITSLSSSTSDICILACSSQLHCHSINFYASQQKCELNSANHLSNPESLVYSHGSQYSNYFLRPPATCSSMLCSGSKTCRLKNDGQSYQCADCQDALGMEDGRIPDSAISASSENITIAPAKYGRLRTRNWTSSETFGDYLQVDLGKVMIVTKLATQGCDWLSPVSYVEKYSVEYSIDNTTWVDYKHNGTKVLRGNSDGSTVVSNSFEPNIKARYVGIVSSAWIEALSLRAELYGCLPP